MQPPQPPVSPIPTQIISAPGVQRDGTAFDSEKHRDAQWCRWQRGRPRKIGGYRALTGALGGISRGLHAYTAAGTTYVHSGAYDRLQLVKLGSDGSISPVAARTPATVFASNANHVWQFAVMQDAITSKLSLIAHAAPNLANIDDTTGGSLFIGDMFDTAALTPIADANVSGANVPAGGIFAIHPYLIAFGARGSVSWSLVNHPQDFSTAGSGQAYVTEQKIVAGRKARGSSGYSPSGLLWSLDKLLRMSFTGGSAVWAFDEVASISILSSSAIVELDGVFYWPGLGRFYAYTGVVREAPNDANLDYFFDGLNFAQRQKVFGFAVPRRGEIWWCYPRATATECTHAVVYNVRENFWYDTQLPNSGRSAAATANVYPYPLMAGVDASSNAYALWQHEIGTDEVNGATILAVPSWFETGFISMMKTKQPMSKQIEVTLVEPDFTQVGDMTMTVTGKANARASEQTSDIYTIPDPETMTHPAGEFVPLRETRRLMSFRFESNTLGGDYEHGCSLAHVAPTGDRIGS